MDALALDGLGYGESLRREGSAAVEIASFAREAATGPTALQHVLTIGVITALGAVLWVNRPLALTIIHAALLCAFASAVLWRGWATTLARPPGRIARLDDLALPPYTVIVPLYHEAAMVPDLSAAVQALDYPRDRLQILIVLEADDEETLRALKLSKVANAFQIVIASAGLPRTKPRACNIALAKASGRYVVVYDAEDRPHPLQLKEAAARFNCGGERLACLQAPLRIAGASGFLSRQFALEYAAQFEIILPALRRLGAPFPLGGTSNHFKTATLRAVGGWDAWNVTEDADLGFRLARYGWRTGALRTPTWERAPSRLRDWLPQRTRWVKGYMQTWGVHMRAPFKGGMGRFAALQATLGLAILSALAHGPVLLLMVTSASVALVRGPVIAPPFADLALLVGGWGSAVLAMSAGARRAGLCMRLSDAAAAPFYWALQSVAAGWSIVQLCTRPHHWNKTKHVPFRSRRIGLRLDEPILDGKGAASVRRAA